MHKTMLAAFITAATVLSVPAFAQAHLGGAVGGAGQIGAGVTAGGALPGAMHTVDQVGNRASDMMGQTDHRIRRTTRNAVRRTRSTATANGQANAGMDANASAHASAAGANGNANASADKSAGLDTAALAGKAGQEGRGVGGEVRDAAHSAIQSSDRTAGSVGDAVKGINASGNASGSANANGNGNARSNGGTKGSTRTRGRSNASPRSRVNAGH